MENTWLNFVSVKCHQRVKRICKLTPLSTWMAEMLGSDRLCLTQIARFGWLKWSMALRRSCCSGGCCCNPQCWGAEGLSCLPSAGRADLRSLPTMSTPGWRTFLWGLPAKSTSECWRAAGVCQCFFVCVCVCAQLTVELAVRKSMPNRYSPRSGPLSIPNIERAACGHNTIRTPRCRDKIVSVWLSVRFTCRTLPSCEATPAIPMHRAPKNTPQEKTIDFRLKEIKYAPFFFPTIYNCSQVS